MILNNSNETNTIAFNDSNETDNSNDANERTNIELNETKTINLNETNDDNNEHDDDDDGSNHKHNGTINKTKMNHNTNKMNLKAMYCNFGNNMTMKMNVIANKMKEVQSLQMNMK